MIMDRYLKIALASIGVALCLIFFKLWYSPQEAVAKDVDLESRLSYISKIIGSIESSVIKIEGDLRVVKRQVDTSMIVRDLSKEQLNALDVKISALKSSVDSIEMDVAEIDSNIAYIETDIDGLASGSCNNIFLCRQKNTSQ